MYAHIHHDFNRECNGGDAHNAIAILRRQIITLDDAWIE